MQDASTLLPLKNPTPRAGLNAAQKQAVDGAIASLRDAAGALLPILHAIQDALGYIPPAAVPIRPNTPRISMTGASSSTNRK